MSRRTDHATRNSRSRSRARTKRREYRQEWLLSVETDRSREIKQRRRRRRYGRMFLWITAAAAIIGGVAYGYQRVYRDNPQFLLRNFEVTTDGRLGESEIYAAAAVPSDASLMELDLAAVEERIRGLSSVKNVRLRRVLPHTLSIAVEERKATAWLAMESSPEPRREGGLLLDSEGVVFTCGALHREYVALPVIHIGKDQLEAPPAPMQRLKGDEMEVTRRLLEQWNDAAPEPELALNHIDLRKGYCLEVYCHDGPRMTFALENLDGQFRKLRDVLSHGARKGRAFATIDLTGRWNVPVTFRENHSSPSQETTQPEQEG